MKIQPGKSKEVQPQEEKATGKFHERIAEMSKGGAKAAAGILASAAGIYAFEARTAAFETLAVWALRISGYLPTIAGGTVHAALLNAPLTVAGLGAAGAAVYVGYKTLFSRTAEPVVEKQIPTGKKEIAVTVRQTIVEDPEKVRELLPKLVNAGVTAEVIAEEIRSLIDEGVFDNSAKNNALFDGMAAYMSQIDANKLRKDLKDQPEMVNIFRHVREINERLEGIKHASKDTKNEWRKAREDFDKIAEDVFIKPIVPLTGKAKEAVDGIVNDIRNAPETVKTVFNIIGSASAANLAIFKGINQLIDEGVFKKSDHNNALFDSMAAYMGQIDKNKLEKDLKEPAMVHILKEVREINEKLEGIKQASKDTKNEWREARKGFDAIIKDALKKGLFPAPQIPPAVQTPSMAPVGKPPVPEFTKATFDRLEAQRKGVPLAGELPKGPAVLPGTVEVLVGIINNPKDVTRIISNLGVFNTAKDLSTFKAILTLIDCGVFETDDEWQALHDGMVAFLTKIDKDDLEQDYKDRNPVFEIADHVKEIASRLDDKIGLSKTQVFVNFIKLLEAADKELKPAARAPITKSEIMKDVIVPLLQAYDSKDVNGQIQIIKAGCYLLALSPDNVYTFMERLIRGEKLTNQQHRQAFIGELVTWIDIINGPDISEASRRRIDEHLQLLIGDIIIHDNKLANKKDSIFLTFMDMIDGVSDDVKQFVYGRIMGLRDLAKADGNDTEKFWYRQMAGFEPIFNQSIDKLLVSQEPSKGKEEKTDLVVDVPQEPSKGKENKTPEMIASERNAQRKGEMASKTSADLLADYKTPAVSLKQKVLILEELMDRLNDKNLEDVTMAFSSIDALWKDRTFKFSSEEWKAIVDGLVKYAKQQDILNAQKFNWNITVNQLSVRQQNIVLLLIEGLADRSTDIKKANLDLTELNKFLKDLLAGIPDSSSLSKKPIEKILELTSTSTSAQSVQEEKPVTISTQQPVLEKKPEITSMQQPPPRRGPAPTTTPAPTVSNAPIVDKSAIVSPTSIPAPVPSTPTDTSTTKTTSTTTTGTVTQPKPGGAIAVPSTAQADLKRMGELFKLIHPNNPDVQARRDALKELGGDLYSKVSVDDKVKIINAVMGLFDDPGPNIPLLVSQIISRLAAKIQSKEEWVAVVNNFNGYLSRELANLKFTYNSNIGRDNKYMIIDQMAAVFYDYHAKIKNLGVPIEELKASLEKLKTTIPANDDSLNASALRYKIDNFK